MMGSKTPLNHEVALLIHDRPLVLIIVFVCCFLWFQRPAFFAASLTDSAVSVSLYVITIGS
jgi:hypothetical protein